MLAAQNSTNSTRGGFNVLGSCDVCNNFLINGVFDNNLAFGGIPGVRPSIDSIDEFNILTGIYLTCPLQTLPVEAGVLSSTVTAQNESGGANRTIQLGLKVIFKSVWHMNSISSKRLTSLYSSMLRS